MEGKSRLAWFFRVCLPVTAAASLVSLVLNHFFGTPGTMHWGPGQLFLAGLVGAGCVLAIAVMAVVARRNRRPH